MTPKCKNPDHPPHASRDQMVCVDQHSTSGKVTHYVFACIPCRDIRKIVSAQVVSTPAFRAYINSNPRLQAYKRARLVERDPTNRRITYFR